MKKLAAILLTSGLFTSPAFAEDRSTAMFGEGSFPSFVSIVDDPQGFAFAIIFNSLQPSENSSETATVEYEGVQIKIYMIHGKGVTNDLYHFHLENGYYTEHEWYTIPEMQSKKVKIFPPIS